jgi:drug/metabolite transporter (DMT)-like permease
MTWKSLFALLWMGPIGTAGAYLYFMYALVDLPVMSVTLFLFLQPLAGSIWGYFLLGDRLTPLQNFGSSLILMAVVLPNALQLKKRAFQSN